MLFLVAALVLALDQLTKALVVRSLALGEAWAPLPSLSWLFTVTHTTNTGAAFGLFPDQGAVFVVIAIVVIGAIVLYYHHLPTEHRLIRFALGLQLGGALGNLTDRLTRGSVVDFIDFKVWPVFNIADSAIVLGVAILALHLTRDQREPPTDTQRQSLTDAQRQSPAAHHRQPLADDHSQPLASHHRQPPANDHSQPPADDQQKSLADDQREPHTADHYESQAADQRNSFADTPVLASAARSQRALTADPGLSLLESHPVSLSHDEPLSVQNSPTELPALDPQPPLTADRPKPFPND